MFRIDAGRTAGYCDGMSRRSFVQLGLAGMASAGPGRSAAGPRGQLRPIVPRPAGRPKTPRSS